MRRFAVPVVLLAFVRLASACSSTSTTDSGGDASAEAASEQDGTAPDTGPTNPGSDSGPGTDGGPTSDGGSDTGTTTDGGTDTGTTTDAGADATQVTDAGTDAGFDAGFDAGKDAGGPPSVQFIGRTDDRDAVNGPKIAWPATRIVARFEGTEASVTLSHTDGFSGGPSYYDILVDGQLSGGPVAVTGGATKYPLVAGLAMGEHTVELYKRTEASLGVDQFRGFDFGAGKLLEPPARAARRIEFLGESQIQGFGIESPTQVCATLADKHNARKSMQQLTATALGAEMVSATYSGKGLGRNSGGDTRYFKTLYPLSVPDDDGTPWDFAKYVPDVIVVSLGGTDLSTNTIGELPAEPVLTARYKELFTVVRGKNANALIIGVVGGQIKDSYPVGWTLRTRMRTSIDNAIAQLADAKIVRFQLAENNNGALETACQYHANETLHGQWATALTAEIKTRTGWQ